MPLSWAQASWLTLQDRTHTWSAKYGVNQFMVDYEKVEKNIVQGIQHPRVWTTNYHYTKWDQTRLIKQSLWLRHKIQDFDFRIVQRITLNTVCEIDYSSSSFIGTQCWSFLQKTNMDQHKALEATLSMRAMWSLDTKVVHFWMHKLKIWQ